MRYPEERAKVVAAGRQMLQRGFTEGTSGNVSMRVDDGALISPSTIPYMEITDEDVVLMDLEGNVLEGERVASVEHKVHLECYKRRPNVGAVVHSHPIVGSAFAAARMPLPAFLDEFGVYIGEEVRVAEWGLSGTQEIADQVADALGEHNAAFIASHGMVAVGRDIDHALLNTARVERAGLIFMGTKLLGEPGEIPEHA
ncbi:MAG: class II aldolase/adducin family protein, partial [Actinomycetota bacterium]